MCKNIAALPASSSLCCCEAMIQYSEEHKCLLNFHNYLLVLKRGTEIAPNWWADLSLHEGLFSCCRVMVGRGADNLLLFFGSHHAVQGTAPNHPSLRCPFRNSSKATLVVVNSSLTLEEKVSLPFPTLLFLSPPSPSLSCSPILSLCPVLYWGNPTCWHFSVGCLAVLKNESSCCESKKDCSCMYMGGGEWGGRDKALPFSLEQSCHPISSNYSLSCYDFCERFRLYSSCCVICLFF